MKYKVCDDKMMKTRWTDEIHVCDDKMMNMTPTDKTWSVGRQDKHESDWWNTKCATTRWWKRIIWTDEIQSICDDNENE